MAEKPPEEIEPKLVAEFAAQEVAAPPEGQLRALAVAAAGYLRRSAGVWPLPDGFLETGLVQSFVAAYASRPTPDYWTTGTLPWVIRSGLQSRGLAAGEEVVEALAQLAIGILRRQGHRVVPAGSAPTFVASAILELYVAGSKP